MIIIQQFWRKKRFFTWVFLALFFMAGHYSLSSSQKSLELSIIFTGSLPSKKIPTYKQGDEIKCLVKLKNVLKDLKIVANTRFHLGYEKSHFREIYFDMALICI